MNARDPGTDAAFDGLRRAHRSERAPDGLRRRVLERGRGARLSGEREQPRSRRLPRGSWLALAAAIAGGLWFAVSRPALDDIAHTPVAQHDAVTPTAEPARPGAPTLPCPAPVPNWPANPADIELSAKVSGLVAQLVDTETAGCGTMVRRYLVRGGAALAAAPPVLIVLHDGGQSAEQAQILTRWWFDDLVQRKPLLLVYANGAPLADAVWTNAGVWQTDAAAHPAVDDIAYLDAVVADVRARGGFAQGEVFLAGYGSGAMMALSAALRHPQRYAGVAAFLPSGAPLAVDISAKLTALEEQPHPLRSIFIAQPRTKDENPSNIAVEWAALFGAEPGPVRVTRQKPGIRRIDSKLRGGVDLRIVTLPEQVNPFPGPGGAERLARAESERRPFFFDGPGAAWEFFQRAEP